MANNKHLPLYDIYTAAFLEFHHLQLNLTRQGTRVVFEAPATEETYKLLREYQNNNLIFLLDYVAVLRRLRARMLEARDGNGRWEREVGQKKKPKEQSIQPMSDGRSEPKPPDISASAQEGIEGVEGL